MNNTILIRLKSILLSCRARARRYKATHRTESPHILLFSYHCCKRRKKKQLR